MCAQRFDARRVAQVQPEDFEAIRPLCEIRFPRIALGRIAGKASGYDESRPRAQQLQAGLIADLDASPGQKCDSPTEVGQLRPLVEVELGARRAHLIVEVVDHGIVLLADVAMR